MRQTVGMAMMLALGLAACQPASVRQAQAPRACGLEAFGAAQGLPLPPPAPRPRRGSKSEPLLHAEGIPVRGGVGDIGKWTDAAPGWRAWRLWLRSEDAKSLSVHLKPLSLPPGAELWICSPDGTVRQGPYRGHGPGQSGQLWSPTVPGPELWLEVLAPSASAEAVELTIHTAFAAPR